MNPEFLAWYGTLVTFTFGLCIGSFLNVCIFRMPRGLSIVHPRSFCPCCGRPIAWFDNIPVLSYLRLRRKCRFCSVSISPRYALVELLTAILFVMVWNHYGASVLTPVFCMVVGMLIVATFVDFDFMIIPDRTSLGMIGVGIVLSALIPEIHERTENMDALLQSIMGVLTGAGLLWLVAIVGRWIFKKDAMGMGDVKLLGGIGAFLGLPGVIYTILISSVIGTVIGLTMIAVGGQKWQSRLPYGPYLAIGAVTWILGGDQLWNWYVNFVTGQ